MNTVAAPYDYTMRNKADGVTAKLSLAKAFVVLHVVYSVDDVSNRGVGVEVDDNSCQQVVGNHGNADPAVRGVQSVDRSRDEWKHVIVPVEIRNTSRGVQQEDDIDNASWQHKNTIQRRSLNCLLINHRTMVQ